MAAPQPPPTRRALPGDRAALATTLTAAFWDDPVQEWLFPDRSRRTQRLTRAFDEELRWFLRLGCTTTVEDRAGAAVWAPPHMRRVSPGAKVRIAVAYRSLIGSRLRGAVQLLNAMERSRPAEAHWYLAMLGTDPAHQGRGIGAALLAPTLARCDEEGVGAYLESSKEANVVWYRRHGFEVTKELTHPSGPSLWLMWRDPRPI